MPVHAKEPAQKMHTQGLSLRRGPYTIPVVPEAHFTPIAQYRQHQCIKQPADAVEHVKLI